MKLSDQRDFVWGDNYKNKYINPTALPAKHVWKYPNIKGYQITILSFVFLLLSIVQYKIYIDMHKLSAISSFCFVSVIIVCSFCVCYGMYLLSFSHVMEISSHKVIYIINSILFTKVYKDNISNFRGIYVLEEERHKIYFSSDYAPPETVYTVLLYHPKFIDIKFPLYESVAKSIALRKAKGFSELLHLPVLDDAGDPVVFEV